MKQHYTNTETGISYTLRGDYYLPDLLPAEKEIELTPFMHRYLQYIKTHRKVFYTNLLTSGKLNEHLLEIDEHAQNMRENIIKQMAESEGVTEGLKEQNPMEWVRKMNNIRNRAEEFVNAEIFCE